MTPREAELSKRLAECQAALAESRRENALLRQKIDLLVRRVFGASSEKLDPAQLQLLLELPSSEEVLPAPQVPPKATPTGSRSRQPRTARLPEHLRTAG